MELDDLDPRKMPAKPKDLSTWNLEDLEEYIARMEAEIVRARDMIKQKKGVGAAADALFKR